MFSPRQSYACAAILAAAALWSVAPPAPAQDTAAYYYETYRYGYNPGYYARRHPVPTADGRNTYFGAYNSRTKTAPGIAAAEVFLSYCAPSPEPAKAAAGAWRLQLARDANQAQAGSVAEIELRVPAGAVVSFGDARTEQTGTLRRFVSPPLSPAKQYGYVVHITWKEGEREVVEDRELSVHGGDHVSASFSLVASK
jgi:uncharacterized protein (TIGR03000 family)